MYYIIRPGVKLYFNANNRLFLLKKNMAAGHVDENAQIAFSILMRMPIPAHIPISIRSLIGLLNTFFHIYTFALFIYFVVDFAALEQFTGRKSWHHSGL